MSIIGRGYLIFLLITFSSCNRKFDKIKWREYYDPGIPNPNRSKMLDDLIRNYKLVNIKYSQLIDLLGKPDHIESSEISYHIVVDYGKDIDPIYTKNLDFSFKRDSIITSYKVTEWKK